MLEHAVSTAVPLAQVALMALGAGVLFSLGFSVVGRLLRGAGLSQDGWRRVLGTAQKVVMAVEQAHGGLSGADKKRLAEEMLGRILACMGFRVPSAVLDVALESTVLLLNAALQAPGPSQEPPAPGNLEERRGA